MGPLVALAALGCGSERSDLAPLEHNPFQDAGVPDPCATPSSGCPCEDPGQVVKCGKVARRSEEYVSCSLGQRTCGADSKWGECIGEIEQRLQMVSVSGSNVIGGNGLNGEGPLSSPRKIAPFTWE